MFWADLLGSIRISLMLSCREGMILVGLLAHLSNDFIKTLCPKVVTFRGAGDYDSNKSPSLFFFFRKARVEWGHNGIHKNGFQSPGIPSPDGVFLSSETRSSLHSQSGCSVNLSSKGTDIIAL